MKRRRITVLVVLLALTALVCLDGRLGFMGRGRGSGIYVHPHLGGNVFRRTAVNEWSTSAAGLARLEIDAESATVNIAGTHTDKIQITARVTATAPTLGEADALLDQFSVDARVEGETLKLAAKPARLAEGRGSITSVYTLAVPREMLVDLDLYLGTAKLSSLEGSVSLNADYSLVEGHGLRGGVEGRLNFGLLKLTELQGPVKLGSAYSTVELELVDDPLGYTIQVESAYGAVEGSVPLEERRENNVFRAWGAVQGGQRPVEILGRFTHVKLDLK